MHPSGIGREAAQAWGISTVLAMGLFSGSMLFQETLKTPARTDVGVDFMIGPVCKSGFPEPLRSWMEQIVQVEDLDAMAYSCRSLCKAGGEQNVADSVMPLRATNMAS